MAEQWIQKAIRRKGALRAKAATAGMSTTAYVAQALKKGSTVSAQTKKQANLAKTLAKLRKKRQ